jgi:PAS domain S-box-containing protein
MAIRYLADDHSDDLCADTKGRMIDSEAFRAVFDASHQGVLVHQRHKPLYVNHAWAALHGYLPDEIMERETVVDLLSPEDRKRLVEYNSNRLAGHPAPTRYHYQIVHRNGSFPWVEIFVQQIEWFGEWAVQCTVIDARPRDDALAERLRRAEDTNERFLRALEESSEGFVLFDRDHRLLVCNRRFFETYPELKGVVEPGISMEELARIRLDQGLIVEAIGREEEWLEERLRNFGNGNRWFDQEATDGRWHQIRERRLPDGSILMSSIDITDRRRAEEALAAEKTLLRAIIDNIPDAIYAKDREAKFILKNCFDADLMGAESAEDTIGKTDFDYYPKEVAQQFFEDDMDVIERGTSIIRKEQKIVHDGCDKPIWVSSTKVPLKNDRGEIIGLVGCSRDVTQRKLMELDLAKHRDHLEELVTERTAEIERQKQLVADALDKERELSALQRQFVSMVGHEFRTPLAVIDGNAQRLLRRRNDIQTEQLTAGADKIRLSVKRLTDLMETVLNAARLEAGAIDFNPQPCDPVEMIADICANYREVNPNYRIIASLDDLPRQFSMDAKLMRQVISNLVSNAIKYSADGSHVWVDGLQTGDGAITISVRDEGLGIPEAELERLFERFFRASTSTGIAGTGIGLNMAKTLVDMHGGSMDVVSKEGHGTTFWVHIPMQSVQTANDSESQREAACNAPA